MRSFPVVIYLLQSPFIVQQTKPSGGEETCHVGADRHFLFRNDFIELMHDAETPHTTPMEESGKPPIAQLESLHIVETIKEIPTETAKKKLSSEDITYRNYADEYDIPIIVDLIAPYLSEPYSVYCYRYFLHGWPQLCILVGERPNLGTSTFLILLQAYHEKLPVGVIVCKQDVHRGKLNRGYIAMLSTDPQYRKLGIATTLVEKAMERMKDDGAQEIVLETEISNKGALSLYERLGFIRAKRLYRFYLNASDAFRLILPVPASEWKAQKAPPQEYPKSSESDSEEEDQYNPLYM